MIANLCGAARNAGHEKFCATLHELEKRKTILSLKAFRGTTDTLLGDPPK